MSSPDTSSDRVAIRRALVSVYDKTGLEDLVRGLDRAGVAVVSTGGSAALIESVGVPVTRVEELTGRSLDSARDRIDFWLALRGRELIGH